MFSEKAPYVVTVILAVLGWSVTHVVDRVTGNPILEYRVESESAGREAVTIQNVTRDHTFRNLTLVFTADIAGSITSVSVIPFEPAFEGDEPWLIHGRTAQFTFPQLQPGWKFQIKLGYTGTQRPRLRFELREGTLRATEWSLETFFLANEVCILLLILVAWVLFLLGAFLYLRPKQVAERPHYL
jgi:hypothetical protein